MRVWVIEGKAQDKAGIFFDSVSAQDRESGTMHGDVFNPAVCGFSGLGEVGNIPLIVEHPVGPFEIGGLAVKLPVLEAYEKNRGAGAADLDQWDEGGDVL